MDGTPAQTPCDMRTVLACGGSTVRDALRALLTLGLGTRVVGEADSAQELRRQVQRHEPDLVVVAWDLMTDDVAALLADLRGSAEGLRVVVLGLRPELRRAALAAGADDYISMVDAPEVVVGVLQPGAEPVSTDGRQAGPTADSEPIDSGGPS